MRLPRGLPLLPPAAGRPPRARPRRRAPPTPSASRPCTSAAGAPPGPSIGVLGGGISGLATAFFALALHEARRGGAAPRPRVTVYEAGARAGGWVDTRAVGGAGARGEAVRFEVGPHTLRVGPSFESRVTVALVRPRPCLPCGVEG
jgi:hypothetical protein